MWLTSAYGAGHRLIARVILTRFASFTAVRKPALEPDRLQQGHPGGAPGQERHARHASDPWRRDARPAPLAARAGPQVTVRVHLRACRAVHHGRLCSACGARWCGRPAGLQGTPTHAAARLRLRPRQQRARYASATGLSRPPQYPAHGALYRVVAPAVQGLLAIDALALRAGESVRAFSWPVAIR